MINYFKNYTDNKKKYSIIFNIIEMDMSYFNKLPHIKFSYNFNDFWLNITNEKYCINFNYNIYTKEIKFDNDSISINKDSIYYKKLQKYMNQLSDKLSDRDDYLSVVNEQRKNFIDILSNIKKNIDY